MTLITSRASCDAKYVLKIHFASHKWYRGNLAPYNLAPYNLATGQFGTGQFGTKSIWHHGNIAPDNLAPGQFGTRTICHNKMVLVQAPTPTPTYQCVMKQQLLSEHK